MKSRKAFTLIELLVVVAIIALLIALLLPTLARAKEEAKTVKCLANEHALALALATYNSQNKDLMPDCTNPFSLPNWNGGVILSWSDAMYIDGDFLQHTDMDGKGDLGGEGSGSLSGGSWQYPTMGYGILQCPKHSADYQQDSSGTPSDKRIFQGYSLAWCAYSGFYNITGGSPDPYSVEARNLNASHIILAEGPVNFGSAYPVPAHMDVTAHPNYFRYGVFERHLRGNTKGATYLFADSHAEFSTDYGWAPSPLSFRSDIKWKTYSYQGPSNLPNGTVNTMIKSRVWAHGASDY